MRRRHTSSESEMSDDHPQPTIAKPTQPPKRHYDESSQSPISSLSEQQQDQSQRRQNGVAKNNKQTIEHSSQSNSSSSSSSDRSSGIDLIQQRIRRLEHDLQEKIDKHKNNQHSRKEPIQTNPPKEPPKTQPKSYLNPPLPAKKQQHKQVTIKQSDRNKNLSQGTLQAKNKLHTSESKRQHEKQQPTSKRKQSKPQKTSQKQSKPSPKQPLPLKPIDKRPESAQQIYRERQNSKNTLIQPNNAILLQQAYNEISQLQNTIDSLRQENKYLKDQLRRKEQKQHMQELQVLKMGASSSTLKLEKEIQTLKALESLQKKLKKSIGRKQKTSKLRNLSSGQANRKP